MIFLARAFLFGFMVLGNTTYGGGTSSAFLPLKRHTLYPSGFYIGVFQGLSQMRGTLGGTYTGPPLLGLDNSFTFPSHNSS